MMLMGHWAPGQLDGLTEDPEALRADLGLFPFPVVEGGAGDPTDVLGGGDGFAIGVNAPDMAVDFVRFLTSAETQDGLGGRRVGAVPPTVSAATDSGHG